MQISDHIYQVLGPMYANLANVYVIKSENSLIMVDCAENEKDLEVIRENLRRFGLDKLPVSHVILTHKHFGHIGNAAYLQQNGAKIICGEGDADSIESGTLNEVMDFSPFQPERDYDPCKVDIRIKDNDELDLDGVKLKFYAVDGHTDGSIIFEYKEGEETVLFVGDVIGITEDCKDTVLGWEGAEDFDAEKNFKSILRMAELKCDIILPGHHQACMQNGSNVLIKAINTALLKYRLPCINKE
ncbi:MAG: MBL fold metallo-hydrolase [Erysipelotrichaceae bacterium]|nr:MBL fold metallo-hydrolase [Erysipelotrichaceae bacterium]